MTKVPSRSHVRQVDADLVEYLLVSAPALASLERVATTLLELDEEGTVRILDLVVIVRGQDDTVEVLELEALTELRPLKGAREFGGLLSDRDVQLASLAVRSGTAGMIVVIEGRWAEPLSRAARCAGGRIVAGARIPRSRVEAACAETDADDPAVP